ncbi:MAG: hypothetical protein OXC95_18285 [Dehalococcoidia bacterium]|nr:hypothetical protein [Dehalococcoidia bacterium]
MTPEERLIRMEIGAELIESAILDFLKENSGKHSTTEDVRKGLGAFNHPTFGFFLQRLYGQDRIANHKTPGSGEWNKWQAL